VSIKPVQALGNSKIRHIWGPWEQQTRSQLRTILFDYIEVFYNRRRHQAASGTAPHRGLPCRLTTERPAHHTGATSNERENT
jgi:hypothetical protein